MTFGEAGTMGKFAYVSCPKIVATYGLSTGSRVSKVEEIQAILDIFQKHGHKEVRELQLILATLYIFLMMYLG